MQTKKIVNFFFELNQLKRISHVGLLRIGVKNVDSVAEHVFRASQIAYILAIMENANPERAATIVLFHDNGEARVGDQDKVAARYWSMKEAEKLALFEQLSFLPKKFQKKLENYHKQYATRNTKEGIIAKDADWLELAFQAKEYIDTGYQGARYWIKNIEEALETKSAKKILKEMKQADFNDWHQELQKMTYTKLKQKKTRSSK